jgi:lipoprotein-anchoring transpeptidase ErfK/SrfK
VIALRRVTALIALAFALAACGTAGGAEDSRPRTESPTPSVVATSVTPSPDPEPDDERSCERYTLIGQVRGRSIAALRRPERGAPVVARFRHINAQGAEQVFPLLETKEVGASTWYLAMLPIRPNGSTGWIRDDQVSLHRSDYRVEVDLSSLRLHVSRLCDEVGSFPIGVGTRDTPTPRGTFFLNSLLRPPRGSVYGAYAYGLSAFSDVIRNWRGGGIVGVHGTNDASSIGRRLSHGCIRLRNQDITWLARRLPLGTLVRIR